MEVKEVLVSLRLRCEEYGRLVRGKLKEIMTVPYLSPDEIKSLEKYQYHSAASTKVDDLLNAYWWTPLSQRIPLNVHPNTLTVAGLICSFVIAYLPFAFFSSDFETRAPTFFYYLTALGIFLYQTLDAIDGKQARRLGLSGPTGQLMDHGCDSLTTFYMTFVILAIIQMGTGMWAAVIITVLGFQLYFYSWYEYTYGIFRSCSGDYSGVTEGQWIIIGLALVAAVSPDFFTSNFYSLFPNWFGYTLGCMTAFMPMNIVIYGTSCYFLVRMACNDFHEILTTRKPENPEKAAIEWISIFFHLFCNATLVLSGTLKRHCLSATTLIAFSGSLLAWRLILSSVARARLRTIEWPSVPFYIVATLCSCNAFNPRIETVVIRMAALWSVFALLNFVHVNLTCIRDHFHTSLFQVPNKINKD